jgi:GNAT superfamily N-acetyltransferase
VKPVVVDVDLVNLHRAPKDCLTSVFWEIDEDAEDLDPFFHKEEWFSSTLLEWGRCGKLMAEGDDAFGFAQYAPDTLFPRLGRFPRSEISRDAVYLAYCFVEEGRRGRGRGMALVRDVARDVVERGYLGLESIGDRDWDGDWVLPERFLSKCGFRVLRDHPRYPLLRLDLLERAESPSTATERVALRLPAFQG